MNKTLSPLIAISIFLSGASSVIAAGNGKVDFAGKVNSSLPCNAYIGESGSENGNIALPAVASSVLQNTGDTAGQTHFQIQLLCDCNPTKCQGAAPGMRVFFESGYAVDSNSGRLINTADSSNSAGNVQLQLLDGQANYTPIKIGTSPSPAGVASTPNFFFDDRWRRAGIKYILNYSVQYYSTGKSTPGKVTSIVTYVIDHA